MLEKTLLTQVNNNPDNIAVVDQGSVYTYEEIYDRVLELADILSEKVSTLDSRVALLFEPSLEGILSTYACLLLNLTFIPISPKESWENIVAILDQSEPEILLTLNENIGNLALPTTTIIAIDNLPIYTSTDLPNRHNLQKEFQNDLAAIVFTSGSSGKPKGVLIPNSGWKKMVETWEKELEISHYHNFLVISGFNFCGFFDDMFMCFFVGGTMHICKESTKRNIRELAMYVRDNKIDFLDLTPAYARQMSRYLESNPSPLTAKSLLVVGSESWFIKDMLSLRRTLPATQIINSYGLTEAVIDSGIFSANEIEEARVSENELVPIGKPFGTTEFFILGEDGQSVEVGQEGELCIASDGLSLGYLNLNAGNNFDVHENKKVVRTGDLVIQNKEGFVKLIGRKDQVIKIQGKRVDLKQIEHIVRQIEGVEDIVVLHLNETNKSSLACFIHFSNKEYQEETWVQFSKIIQEVAALPGLPLSFYSVEDIPRKADGKTNYLALKKLIDHNKINESKYAKEMNIFHMVFKENIGEDFIESIDIFLQGADSLTIEMINLDLEKHVGFTIPISVFYQERTLNRILDSLSLQENNSLISEGKIEVLHNDIQLPSEIKYNSSPERVLGHEHTSAQLSPVLLTGSTGFLGIHLLEELLSKSTEVFCLVRGESEEIAFQKLANQWLKYSKSSLPINTIKVAKGDFSMPYLGLSREQYDFLSMNIKSIIHAGYWINFLLDYSFQRKINVLSMDNLLTFASNLEAKPFTFISSSSASLINSDDSIQDYEGYELTKYINERKLQQFGNLGYGYNIFAPAFITPSPDKPIFPKNDFFWSFVQSCLAIRALPQIDWGVDLVPADELAQIIASNLNMYEQKIIITNDELLTMENLKSILDSVLGESVALLPFNEWLDLIKLESKKGINIPLRPFISGLTQKKEKFFDSRERNYPPGSKIATVKQSSSELLLNYLSHKNFDSTRDAITH